MLILCFLFSVLLARLIYKKESSVFDEKMEVIFGEIPLQDKKITHFDKKLINDLIERINHDSSKCVSSLIIVQNDSIVLEKYFDKSYVSRHRYRLRSVTGIKKSFTSVLIGIAIEQGKIKGTDEKIMKYFSEYGKIANYNNQKKSITIENALTMSAGFEWDELSYSYSHDNNSLKCMRLADDWVKYILDLPLSEKPGSQFTYNSGCTLLLSEIIQKASGQPVEKFAMDNLFSKMGIVQVNLQDLFTLFFVESTWGRAMRPIDLALFGLLYLHKGQWNGEQIIPESWIETSTGKWIEVNMKNYPNRYYGMHWFRYSDNHPITKYLKVNDIYYARGIAGNFLWIIPHLDMVVVKTVQNYDKENASESILWEYILPAFVKE